MKMKNLDKSCSEKRGLHENGGEKNQPRSACAVDQLAVRQRGSH